MIVKLRRKNARYPDLTPGQAYAVIGVESDDFRLLNDRGQPYLYRKCSGTPSFPSSHQKKGTFQKKLV